MIRCRPFLNSDTPLLVDIWRSQPAQRGLNQPLTTTLFEQMVLAKPYFDAAGLFVALEGDRGVGFVHAGFGPNNARDAISCEVGAIAMMMVRPEFVNSLLAPELLKLAEDYLRRRHAQSVIVHGNRSINPFYLGLYGGSEILGMLHSDPAIKHFLDNGFARENDAVVLNLDVSHFRPLVDRRQVQLRRRLTVDVLPDPPAKDWWEACTYGGFDRLRFDAHKREGGPSVADVTVWNMLPLCSSWGIHAVGLMELSVQPGEHRQGTATYLMGEAVRHLSGSGVSVVEAQVPDENDPALALFGKLGFVEVDRTVSLRKML